MTGGGNHSKLFLFQHFFLYMGAPLTYLPQGFGITNQAGSCEVDILMNPFAQALQRASHILAIPNSKISIYSSLDFDGWMDVLVSIFL